MPDNSLSRRKFLQMLSTGAAAFALPASIASAQTTPPPDPATPAVPTAPLESLVCPILMYHYVSQPPEDADRYLTDLTVLPETFAQHLDHIQSLGFTSITMRDMWLGMIGAIPLPPKPIVFTFDDGYWDSYAIVAPSLLERGMTGTIYAVSSFMDQPGYLTWAQAQELHNLGIEIGSHSVTHSDMSWQDRETQRIEIEQSAQAIGSVLGERPVSFCYPFGRHNYISQELLFEHGYATAVTTSDATKHFLNNPYLMGRVRIRNNVSLPGLTWLVERVA